jgi:2-oxoglutarate ferredoxin oxidoreductase subunit alpha
LPISAYPYKKREGKGLNTHFFTGKGYFQVFVAFLPLFLVLSFSTIHFYFFSSFSIHDFMKEYVNWKIGGEAGYGILSVGVLFGKFCTRNGLYVFYSSEFPSLVRGGHNTVQLMVRKEPVLSQHFEINLLVALNQETITRHLHELSSDAAIIFDSKTVDMKKIKVKKSISLIDVPLNEIALRHGKQIMRNTVALGASIALLGLEFNELEALIKEAFSGKKDALIPINIAAAKEGFNFIKNRSIKFNYKLKKQKQKNNIFINGNDAFCLGAVKSGLKFVAEYPMTPSSSILSFMAAHELQYDIVVKQTEDEIAAMNMIIGAGFAGVRALTATSGGGFSLMVEGLGLAGMSETPIVVVESQRPGPSTGLPTMTEQGDLLFVLNASQGEFPRMIVAPGDVTECFEAGLNSFNFAEKYQLPVIVLLDKYLSEGNTTTEMFSYKNFKLERGKLLVKPTKNYLRYAFTSDGISPRVLPGSLGTVYKANGDEHNEKGVSEESEENRKKMMDKRMKKLELLKKEIPEPKLYGNKNAKITLIAWGSTKGIVLEALKQLQKQKIKANFLHYVFIYPFKEKRLLQLLKKSKKVLLIENNKTSQLGKIIAQETGIQIKDKLLKYTGRQFFPHEIVEKVKRL